MKISIVIVLSVLIISFLIFFIIQKNFYEYYEKLDLGYVNSIKTFNEFDIDLEEKTVVLIGSSHLKPLNSTYLEGIVSSETGNHVKIFNLSRNGDTPSSRVEEINEIINSNPSLVLYGVGYRDFRTISFDNIKEFNSIEENNFLNIKKFLPLLYFEIEKIISVNFDYIISPKTNTLLFLKHNIENDVEENAVIGIEFPKTKNEIIEILNENPPSIYIPTIEANRQNYYLELMINKLKESEIDVIIFTTPHLDYFKTLLNEETKSNFENILKNIESKVDVIYLDSKYSDLEIWHDGTHISINKSLIYNDDISKIIISNLK